MDAAPMDPVALTSRWVAAARARESERPDRLFEDPFARPLAGDKGFELLARMDHVMSVGGENPYLPIRTRYLDDRIAAAVASPDLRQVVIVAAGMDARAFRLAWPAGTRLWELDRPEVLGEKARILDELGARAGCERRTIGCDLTRPWTRKLEEAELDRSVPALFLLEGLLAYLEPASVETLLRDLSQLAAGGSHLLADVPSKSFLRTPFARRFLRALSDAGSPFRFGTNDPERLFERHGWEARVTQPGGEGASFGRWPYPLPPRWVPLVPRSFFVSATRRPGAR